MQRDPRQTQAGAGGNAGATGRERGHRSSVPPPTPPTPFLCTESPHVPAAPSPWGARGGQGAGEQGNATGSGTPSAAGCDPGRRRLRGRADSTGKALHHHPPSQPQVGLGVCSPAAGGCPANPSRRTRGGGGRGGGEGGVSGLCQTPTCGICMPPASRLRQALPTPPSSFPLLSRQRLGTPGWG